MASALVNAGRLKPEVRLGQAISQFQADLSMDQKARFQSSQSNSMKSPPDLRDVMRLTAEMNRRECGTEDRCFGPRVTNFLQAVQGFASLGDIVLGGTQNLLACGVWAVVRLTLLGIVKYSSYFERLSLVLMDVGRSAPRYQAMGAIYSESSALRSSMLEYFTIVVRLCHHVVRLGRKSAIGKWASTLSDASLSGYQSDLERWAKSVKEEVNLTMAEQLALATQERTWFRSHIMRRNEADIHAQKIRKSGNVTLLRKSTTYASWKDRDKSCTLLCTGRLGSGKSVLLANVIEDIAFLDHKTAITYFFCQHEVAESLAAPVIIGSLVRQLLQALLTDPESVSEHLPGNRPLSVEQMLRLVARALPQDHRVYLILDGLGHCEPEEQRVVIGALKTLQDKYTTVLCVSMRLDPVDVPQHLINQLHQHTVFTMPKKNPDIERFVNAELQRCIESERLVLRDPLLILEVEERLCQGAQGMFLWVVLQIKALCLEKSDADIRQSLGNLPTSLSEIYSAILAKAQPGNTKYQLKLFEIVLVARRPLTTEEMREALSVVPGNTNWDPQRLPNDIHGTIGCCAGLLVIDEDDLSIHMVHHSVKPFLLNDYRSVEAFRVERAHERMDNIVLTFLNFEIFSKRVTSSKALKISASTVASSTLGSTTRFLGGHQAQKLALKLLKVDNKADRDIGPTLLTAIEKTGQSKLSEPLEFHKYAAIWWPQHVWHLNLDDGLARQHLSRLLSLVDLQIVDACGRTPLSYAAQRGNTRVAGLLLAHGASLTPDIEGNTPLIWAVKSGHTDMIECFIQFGLSAADINAADPLGRTPLILAVAAENAAITRLLIMHSSVDINARDVYGRTPLIYAAIRNWSDGMKCLLQTKKVNANLSNATLDTALHLVAGFGNVEIVRLLLSVNGVDAVAKNREAKTALHIAAANGHLEVVKELIKPSVNVLHQVSLDGNTALGIATQNNHIGIVKALAHGNPHHRRPGSCGVKYTAVECDCPHYPAASDVACEQDLEHALCIAAHEGNEILVVLLAGRASTLTDLEIPRWLAKSRGHVKISYHLSKGLTKEIYLETDEE